MHHASYNAVALSDLVTVISYNTAHEAELARSALEAAGIQAFVINRHFTSMGFHDAVISGGVKLQVADADAEEAERVLNEIAGLDVAERSTPNASLPFRFPEQCERCGSPDIRKTHRLAGFAVFAMLVFAAGVAVDQLQMAFYLTAAASVFFLVASTWRCADCGHRWS